MAEENISNELETIDLMLMELQAMEANKRPKPAPVPEQEANPFVRSIAEFNQALVLNYLPAPVRKKLNELGLGVSEPKPGIGYEAARMTGEAVPYMIAPYAAGVREMALQGIRTAENVGGRILQDLGKTWMSTPGRVVATEVAGSTGAGAGEEIAEVLGGEEAAQGLGALTGGVGVSSFVGIVPRMWDTTVGTIRRNILPFTRAGGKVRAGQQMQNLVGTPEIAEAYAQLLDDPLYPRGVTPARFLQDNNLMAQEAKIIEMNPEYGSLIEKELLAARKMALQELTETVQRSPNGVQQWQKAVIQNVAPDGVQIKMAPTAKMLDQAYQAYTPLYNQYKGFPVGGEEVLDDLTSMFTVAVNNPKVIATADSRGPTLDFLKNEMTAIANPNAIKTEDLIDLRSAIRAQIRKEEQSGFRREADLLGSAEAGLTDYLNKFIPPDLVDDLRVIDSQYRQYKVIERAVYNSADNPLTPEMVSESIRTGGLTTPSQYARGVDPAVEELRALAISGRDPINYLSDRQTAVPFMRRLDVESRQRVRNFFLEKLFERAIPTSVVRQEFIEGTPVLRGQLLEAEIANNIDTMRNIGFKPDEINRLKQIASSLSMMERPSPAASEKLLTDGPSMIMELAASVVGAKQGSNIAHAADIGQSLVLAQYFSNRARKWLRNATEKGATQLLIEAVNNRKLYQELLRAKPTPVARRRQAQYIESYMGPIIMDEDLIPDILPQEDYPVIPRQDDQEPTPPPQARVQPPAPPTRGVPGMGGQPTPAPGPVAQGPQVASQGSREMLKSLFPFDTTIA